MNNATKAEIAEAYGFPKGEGVLKALETMSSEKNRFYSREEIAARVAAEAGIRGLDDPTPHGTVMRVFSNLVSTYCSAVFKKGSTTSSRGFERTKKKAPGAREAMWHYRHCPSEVPTLPAPVAGTDVVSLLTRIAVAQERIAAALESRSISFS